MTTNFTAILNANLDQIDGYDYPTDLYELADGTLITEYELWDSKWDDESYEDDPEADAKWEAQAREHLCELQHRMDNILFRCGVYGAEEWAEVASVYSDVYKDIYGCRPHGIGLRYHGIVA